MDLDAPQFRCLIALNELKRLDFAVHERVKKSAHEYNADFEKLEPALKTMGLDLDDPAKRLSVRQGHLRRSQDEEKRLLRQSRRCAFAIGFSTFERFLDLRLRALMPNGYNEDKKPKFLKFSCFKKFLEGCKSEPEGSDKKDYFSGPDFEAYWEKCDLYRIARNKITHQAGYVDPMTNDREATKLLTALNGRLVGVMLHDSEDIKGWKEIHIEELFLNDVLTFFENFALRIDSEVRSWEARGC
jgi:hypothetical protein